ncbi:MBL fold metallo-hydrolase [Salinibius halmophilus]|uniref:MBL fold metallo-hydrolase n=1 Tax=Salinibius halmophilus TaxID=1853216 RepID=UPI000E66E3FF|nr:MBL fold metallo-hydrolase [Salinibius halmophilus]
MLKHLQIAVTPFQQNCSIVYCDQTKDAALVDPGGDTQVLKQVLAEQGLTLKAIWLTHGHLDHVGGSAELANEFAVEIIGPGVGDAFWLEGLDQQAQMFGLPQVDKFVPHKWFEHGDVLELAGEKLTVRFTPGHTPGHMVFYHADTGVVFVGDVLFAGGVGRSDFPQGNHEQLMQSIQQQLLTLPDETTVVSGHGPTTTIGKERRSNPFILQAGLS